MKKVALFVLLFVAIALAHVPRRIVGGQLASDGQFPFQVALIFTSASSNGLGQFCGGSLIASQWVLTAGHCVRDIVSGEDTTPGEIKILIGETDLDGTGGQEISVTAIYPHPTYTSSNSNPVDVALLQLTSPATVGGTILLPNSDQPWYAYPGDSTVSGWGATNEAGTSYPTLLYYVSIPIVSLERCNRKADDIGAYPVSEEYVCAGEDGMDSCYGDSGGPLFVENNGQTVQVGVVSYGLTEACNGVYGVYTLVHPVKSWIESYTGALTDPDFVGSTEYPTETFDDDSSNASNSLPVLMLFVVLLLSLF